MIAVRSILQAFEDSVTAIKLPAEVFDSATAFQAVKQYDLQGELRKALEDLLVFKDRVAFILLDQVTYDNQRDGRVLTTARTVSVTVLCADRNWGNRQIALKGNAATPGVQLLQELLIDALFGELIEGTSVEPNLGQLFALMGKERDNNSGRLAWSQEFTVRAGTSKRQLSRLAV